MYIVHFLGMIKECMALYESKFLKVYNFSLSCKFKKIVSCFVCVCKEKLACVILFQISLPFCELWERSRMQMCQRLMLRGAILTILKLLWINYFYIL